MAIRPEPFNLFKKFSHDLECFKAFITREYILMGYLLNNTEKPKSAREMTSCIECINFFMMGHHHPYTCFHSKIDKT